MKKVVLFYAAFVWILGFSGCVRNKLSSPISKLDQDIKPVQVSEAISSQQPVKTRYSAQIFKKQTPTGCVLCPAQELVPVIANLAQEDLLTCAYELLFMRGYTIQEKSLLFDECKKQIGSSGRAVVEFFSTVLGKHADYLNDHPLTDLNNSLVSYACEHAELSRSDDEITTMLWPVDDLYGKGNNLLQEAIFLKNEAAVDYLLSMGADPRHLCDARGSVLALEWVDKHEIESIALKLAQTLNKIDPDSKTTILDEVIYSDPRAANLIRKYGGKLAVELV